MGKTAHSGEALELAVGLLRAPALRGALRTRPLSAGVGEVLAIASGSPTAVRRAAERTGYDPAMLLEASRFYVQQVLLTEGTDAYRVLGADRHANRETLRNHHHLLQRWLHPDRSEGAQWDSALSTRVNQAWNQLRTDAARAEYNAAEYSAAQAAAEAEAEAAAQATPVPARSVSAPASPLGAAMTAIASPTAPPASRRGPIAVAFLALACLVLAWLAITREDPFDNVQAHSHEPTRNHAGAATAATSAPDAISTADTANTVAATDTATDTANMADAADTPDAPDAPDTADITNAGAPAAATSDGSGHPEIAAIAAPATARANAGIQVITPSAPIDSIAVIAFADASTSPRLEAMEATDTAHVEMPVAAVAAPAEGAVDPLQLFEEAEGAVRTTTVWLAATTAPQPTWLNAPAAAGATAVRTRLHASAQGRARARMAVDVPNWTLGDQAASMFGIYRLEDPAGATLETGVFQIELTRRDRRWHVAALALDPMP